MRALKDYHPITVALYLTAAILPVMLEMNPILLLLSLVGAIFYYVLLGGRGHAGFFLLFLAMTLVNPIFSHNGKTVLFFVNQAPITLESLVWGAVMAGTVVAVLYWFRALTRILTSDRLLCLFGMLSPRLALTLSMALRYVPRFSLQMKKVNRAQRAMGLYRDDHIVCRVRGGVRVLSVMLTWSLEHGIVTADSMAARGYGLGRRTHFTVIRFCKRDAILLSVTFLLAVLTLVPFIIGDFSVTYYPELALPSPDLLGCVGYGAYGLLCMIPTILEGGERLRWKFLRSSI